MWTKTTGEIAELVNGTLHGDSDREITGVAPMDAADDGDIGYVAEEKYRETAAQSGASALIVSKQIPDFPGDQIICEDPEVAFLNVLESLSQETAEQPEGIHDRAIISPEARLADGVSVGACAVVQPGATLENGVVIFPHAYIGHDVHIGQNTVVHPHVTVCQGVHIGRRCVIRPNAVIGDDGFGFVQREGASYRKQHVASVHVGDDVEIGGLSSVDRGMLEDTSIGNGVKIDKHCHIAHNCVIEDHCILAGYARMGGSCTVRRGAVLAADVRMRDHIEIGEGAVLAAGTGAAQDVEAGSKMWGVPARPLREEMRLNAMIGRLPDMRKTIHDLQSKVEELEEKLENQGD